MFFFACRGRHPRLQGDWSSDARSSDLRRPNLELRLVGAVILGLAICSMHYTAMAAASLTPTGHSLAGTGLDELTLALWEIGRASCRERGQSCAEAGGRDITLVQGREVL